MPNKDRSLQTFRIQVECGLPGGLLQLSGGCINRIRLASAISFIRVTCINRESRRDLTTEESGGCWVIRRTASFLTKSCQRMSKILRKQHWSDASVHCTSAFLTIQHCKIRTLSVKCKHCTDTVLSRLQFSISRDGVWSVKKPAANISKGSPLEELAQSKVKCQSS